MHIIILKITIQKITKKNAFKNQQKSGNATLKKIFRINECSRGRTDTINYRKYPERITNDRNDSNHTIITLEMV